MYSINDEEFRLLVDFTAQKCGIVYHEKQKYTFQQKLIKRLEANGLKTFKDYYFLLKYSPSTQELQELYNVLTVNETYFLREKEHIICLRDEIIPEIINNRPNKIIKILSAGCSTGEEAYSTSILLNEKFKDINKKLLISGIDISKKALDIAQSGTYRKISLTFRSVDKTFISTYFDLTDDSLKLKEEIRNSVKFKWGNLFEPITLSLYDKFNVIFCRNVMIYFDKKFKQNLVNQFYDILEPEGYLILSNTENLNDINSKFKMIRKSGVFIYQKA